MTIYAADVVAAQHETSERWCLSQALQALYVVTVHVQYCQLREVLQATDGLNAVVLVAEHRHLFLSCWEHSS